MKDGVEIGDAIVEHLKDIYPRSATKKEIFKAIDISSCSGEAWLQTVLASHDVEMGKKKGRYNTYRYKKT